MKEDLDEILGRYFTGDSTPDEKEWMDRWKNEPDNQALYRFMKMAWTQKESETRKENDWAIINAMMGDQETEPNGGSNSESYGTQESNRFIKSKKWLKIAASVLLVLGVGVYAITSKMGGDTTSQMLSYEATKGRKHIALADGTSIDLDKGGALQVIQFSDQVRELSLEGRAYFDVASDKNRPFVIRVGETTTTVLGTKFSLGNHVSHEVEVILEEGAVAFEKGNEKVILAPNERAVSKVETAELNKYILSVNQNTFSWKTGVVVFENTTIDEVAADLQRHYGIAFNFPETSSDRTLNARFKEKSIEQVALLISELMDLTYKRTPKSVDFDKR